MLSVETIAFTTIAPPFAPGDYEFPHGFVVDGWESPADALAEFAGRACYQSWQRPNPATATNEGYMENILDHAHFSVIEHASLSLYVQGVSRSLTHELVRHRHFAYSQLSQRFVDESNVTFVVPPAVRELLRQHPAFVNVEPREEQDREIEAEWQTQDFFREVRTTYADLVKGLTAAGLSRKEIREAARAVLPNCTETKIVVTGNLRAWRDFFPKRMSESADAEIREFAQAAYEHVSAYAPHTFPSEA